jgi:cell division protein FtsB
MRLVEEIRRRARAITGPILAISLVFYFSYHLFAGDRGFLAWIALSQELRAAKATLADLDAQRETLDRRVGLLRPDHLDPDLLDERARAVLNLAAPDEIVIPLTPAPPATAR